MPWSTDHAPRDADLDACVTCGLCLPVCPTFRLTGDEAASPRGRLAAIGAVGSGRVDLDERFAEVTGFCLQCRACETACPSMVPYGEILEGARAEVAAQLPATSGRVRRFAVGRGLRRPLALRLGTVIAALLQRLGILRLVPRVGGPASGLRDLPLRPRTVRGGEWGPPSAESVTLFAGCVADVWFGDIHRAAIEVLVAAGHRVVAPSDQTCCGALAAHDGLAVAAEAMARENIEALAGDAPIVVDVAGCGAHLKGYGRLGAEDVAARVRDITEMVSDAITDGRLPVLPSTGRSVAVMDPCHLEHGQSVTAAPRRVVEAAGYTVVDADGGGLCCGAAGLYQLDHPDTSRSLGERKAAAVRDTGAAIVAAANAGCEMQLRRFLGAGFEARHPVELYAERLRLDVATPR